LAAKEKQNEKYEPAEKRELNADALVVGEVKKDGHEGEESEEEWGLVDASGITQMQAGSRKKRGGKGAKSNVVMSHQGFK